MAVPHVPTILVAGVAARALGGRPTDNARTVMTKGHPCVDVGAIGVGRARGERRGRARSNARTRSLAVPHVPTILVAGVAARAVVVCPADNAPMVMTMGHRWVDVGAIGTNRARGEQGRWRQGRCLRRRVLFTDTPRVQSPLTGAHLTVLSIIIRVKPQSYRCRVPFADVLIKVSVLKTVI